MTSPITPERMTVLRAHAVGDTVLFYSTATAADGVTPETPSAVSCSVYDADSGSVIVSGAVGTPGSGYGQYLWAGSLAAGRFLAILTLTLSGSVIQSEFFTVDVLAKPVSFTTDLDTEIGEVRMELGDDKIGRGVLPDGGNLPDGIISKLLERESTVMRAVAAACELLARRWSTVANLTLGPRSEQLGEVADNWRKRAAELRDAHGTSAAATIEGGVIGLEFSSEIPAYLEEA